MREHFNSLYQVHSFAQNRGFGSSSYSMAKMNSSMSSASTGWFWEPSTVERPNSSSTSSGVVSVLMERLAR